MVVSQVVDMVEAYTGTYVNNGTINTAGGYGHYTNISNGGAGGIKTTKITL